MALQEHGEVREDGLPCRREELESVGTGRMGSTFYRWRFVPAHLSAVLDHDWWQLGRRAFLNPECGEVTLMAPSVTHEDMSRLFVHVVPAAAQPLSIPCVATGATTWSMPGSRRVEADESFYLGEAALGYQNAKQERQAGMVDAFVHGNPPQLVVEVERAHGDSGKPDVYRDLGVAEMWRVDLSRNQELSVEFLELQHPEGWRAVDQSGVLPGLTPELVARILETAYIDGAADIAGLLAAAGVGREEPRE